MTTKRKISEKKNKTALITGASSGIGLALSEVFAEHGFNLVLVARRKEKLDALATRLSAEQAVQVKVIALDLMQLNAAQTLLDEVKNLGIQIDVLVNNAGRGHYGAFLDAKDEDDMATLQLNVVALTSLTRLFAREMQKQGAGAILNVASIAGFFPGPMMAVYNATKAYVLSLSEALNTELADKGISVTASCPGPTETEFVTHSGTDKLHNLKFAHFMSARKVAEQAYDATMKGKPVVVHGGLNKTFTFLPRLLPRAAVSGLISKTMK